jgi:hypothetical protein
MVATEDHPQTPKIFDERGLLMEKLLELEIQRRSIQAEA